MAPAARNGPKGIPAVSRRQAGSRHEVERDREHEEEPDEERREGRVAERRADEERELHVAHPHSAWVDEQREEEEERGAYRRDHPLNSPVWEQGDLRHEDETRRG